MQNPALSKDKVLNGFLVGPAPDITMDLRSLLKDFTCIRSHATTPPAKRRGRGFVARLAGYGAFLNYRRTPKIRRCYDCGAAA